MAATLMSKTSFHARSISLPSRPHPVAEQFQDNLCRLRSSENASTSSTSHKLSIVADLYACVDELLQLAANQKSIAQQRCLDETLDASLRLLDICSTARDVLQLTKEHIQVIQSALRRKLNGELSIDQEVAQYLNARKLVKKTIKNCLKQIKNLNNKYDESSSIMGLLSDAETTSSEIFKSLLVEIAGSKKSSWFCKIEVATNNKYESLDDALNSVIVKNKKTGINVMQVDSLISQMMKLESEIDDIDEALEGVFRQLVKSRASLLNIISQ